MVAMTEGQKIYFPRVWFLKSFADPLLHTQTVLSFTPTTNLSIEVIKFVPIIRLEKLLTVRGKNGK
jgi:hypothetical protein